ncbi:MAG: ATP synthase F1 subunit gamma [Planctomycetota bacterium]|nr:ATP synthase F1 subunit gamma [Planctomycetota bacterium]MDE1889858.1 ATP synthase F1 subunit gamma [Planctomycetota bacterium]MDE2217157.1 ATP synthase F1 subunit gamma [Planctomycetota bacterium]
MLSTKEIKQRIRSISSIKQITRAMEMVAASRLKKVESRVLASRAYTERMHQILNHLVSSSSLETAHPCFAERAHEIPVIKIILITADKGLCGAYNNNVIQKVVKFAKEHADKTIRLVHIGKKGNLYFSKGGYSIEKYFPENVEKFGYSQVKTLASHLFNGYEAGEFGQLYIFFTKFNTVMQSFPSHIQLLPVEKGAFETKEKLYREYIFEPLADQIIEHLFPKYIETQIYQCILESLTSEYAARRVAMIAATENAGEMIDELTRSYNKARQETITKELLEVISGAEALIKG